jgi:aminobenzoyl-glutamate utilization protein B
MFTASETVAGTIVDLCTKPETLQAATEEFKERTGGGVGGSEWVPPQLPEDHTVPTDLPWPEYVETPRGREWSLATPTRTWSGSKPMEREEE